MPVKIRLARRGRKKKPFYHIIIADARAPRDGKFIEQVGSYNPMTVPATIELDRDKAFDWIMKGAQPTNTVRAILKFKGVMYRKHLMRGVTKGALSEEKAMEMYQEWIDNKEEKVAARVEETKKKKAEFWKMVSGEIKPAKKKADTEAAEAFREPEDGAAAEATTTTDEAPAEAPAPPAAEPVKEETPDAEKPAEPVKEEAPVAEKAAEPVKEEAPAAEKPAEPVKEEAPAAEPAKEAAVAAASVATTAAAVPTEGGDDLTKIEGVGPAIAKVLTAAGVGTFSALEAKSAEDVKAILTEAGGRFSMHDPTTWGMQAGMAAKGEWDALKKWQDESDGGKPVG